MNFLKLNKSMLLLVAIATFASQAQAGWKDMISGTYNSVVNGVTNAAGYVVDTAMEYPKTSFGLAAAVTVPAAGFALYKGYKKATKPAVVKTAKIGAIGTAGVASVYGVYKVAQTDVAKQAYDVVSPYVINKNTGLVTGVVLGLGATAYGAKKAYNYFKGVNKPEDNQQPEEQPQPEEQDPVLTPEQLIENHAAEVLNGVKIFQCNAQIAGSVADNLTALASLLPNESSAYNACESFDKALSKYEQAPKAQKAIAAKELMTAKRTFARSFVKGN